VLARRLLPPASTTEESAGVGSPRRLLKKAHLLRWRARAALRRTG
jgi:hypothetical protein